MQTRQGHKAEKLVAVSSFIHENADRLPRTYACPALPEFDSELARLRTHFVKQETMRINGMNETRAYKALRSSLIMDHMKPVVVAARIRTPVLESPTPYKMPRHNLSCVQLTNAALGLAGCAGEKPEMFLGAGLQPDFSERLIEAARAMEAAWDRRRRFRGSRSESTDTIVECLRKASGLIELLTVFVRQDTAGDPALFAEWSALALRQAPRRVREPTARVQLAQPATATARLLGSGTAEPSAPTTSRRGLFGTVTRLLRLPAAS